ncbi:hypothetical protein HYT25_02640 [Candidatus Pacearchaeota archaeon]|nr:hypothetical protein [Candidatus Pacearchaeota archaeon]
MNLIETKKYERFRTEFYITPKVNKFLKNNNVNYDEILEDDFHWYEHSLFEQVDENDDGIPDEKFGKKFKVIYYGIVIKWIDKKPEGFEDKFKYDKKKLISDWIRTVAQTLNHKSFAIKYKILMKEI